MKNICVAGLMGRMAATFFADGEPLVLKASKVKFSLSNKRNRNQKITGAELHLTLEEDE